MKLVVFDVGGTEIKYSVMDQDLRIENAGYVPTPMDTLEHFLQTLRDIYLPYKEEVEGIAVSLPGFVDSQKGRINGGGALLYNYGQDVGPQLAALCGCPVHLENDGKAAAMAELWKGSLQGCQNAAVFIIGTGVGGGLIIDGKLVRGPQFTAGEFSFLNCNADAWEDFHSGMASRCSTPALLGRYKALKGMAKEEPLDGRQFFARLAEGDSQAKEALECFCKQVAIQIYNLSALLNLEKVAIGGGISRQPILAQTIQEQLDLAMSTTPWAKMGLALPIAKVVSCQFANDANQIGAMYSYMLAKGLL